MAAESTRKKVRYILVGFSCFQDNQEHMDRARAPLLVGERDGLCLGGRRSDLLDGFW